MLISTSHHVYQQPFHMNHRPNCERQSTKPPRRLIGKYVPDGKSGKDFFKGTQKALSVKEKVKKLHFI